MTNLEQALESANRLGRDLDLSRCLNEEWFSDTLAWLLNPNESHGFGKAFLEGFVRRVARIRKQSDGGASSGSQLNRNSVTVIREFYVKDYESRNEGSRTCDLIVMDLSPENSLMICIENKLFTHDSEGQLDAYRNRCDHIFATERYREYVYLTLQGSAPRFIDPSSQLWVSVSWLSDILEVLAEVRGQCQEPISPRVCHLERVLNWLEHVCRSFEDQEKALDQFAETVMEQLKEAVEAELNRVSKNRGKEWKWMEGTKPLRAEIHPAQFPRNRLSLSLDIDRPAAILRIGPRTFSIPLKGEPNQFYQHLHLVIRQVHPFFFDEVKAHPSSYSSMGWNDHQISEPLKATIRNFSEYGVSLRTLRKLLAMKEAMNPSMKQAG